MRSAALPAAMQEIRGGVYTGVDAIVVERNGCLIAALEDSFHGVGNGPGHLGGLGGDHLECLKWGLKGR